MFRVEASGRVAGSYTRRRVARCANTLSPVTKANTSLIGNSLAWRSRVAHSSCFRGESQLPDDVGQLCKVAAPSAMATCWHLCQLRCAVDSDLATLALSLLGYLPLLQLPP